MQSQELYNLLFQAAHDNLEEVMADVDDTIANWVPDQIVGSIGAQYVHLLTAEDTLVNAVLQGGAPLLATQFAGKIGAASAPELSKWGEWGRTTKVDVAAAKVYAQAVYAATSAYVCSLTEAQLSEVLDLTQAGLGHMTRAVVLSIALQQPYVHSGEISVLKGLQGLRGYKF